MKNFELIARCALCDSEDVRLCRQLDFTGWEDDVAITGNVVLSCQLCKNKELLKLEYEIVY